jgi:predicted O-methyltransferase YrrM
MWNWKNKKDRKEMILPQGWFSDEDINAYRHLVECVPSGGTIVELGVWKGRSLCSIADIIKRKKLNVYAVDTFQGADSEPDTYKEAKEVNLQNVFLKNIRMFGVNPSIYAMTTEQASKEIDTTFDLVFIDADHSYDAIRMDLDNWITKCCGTIAGHDYDRDGIYKAINESFNNIEYRGLVWWARTFNKGDK